jgi:hypothetical protein
MFEKQCLKTKWQWFGDLHQVEGRLWIWWISALAADVFDAEPHWDGTIVLTGIRAAAEFIAGGP